MSIFRKRFQALLVFGILGEQSCERDESYTNSVTYTRWWEVIRQQVGDEHLVGLTDARDQAGIHPKHVGVIWENLEVQVVGPPDVKVGILWTLGLSGLICASHTQIYARTLPGLLITILSRELALSASSRCYL